MTCRRDGGAGGEQWAAWCLVPGAWGAPARRLWPSAVRAAQAGSAAKLGRARWPANGGAAQLLGRSPARTSKRMQPHARDRGCRHGNSCASAPLRIAARAPQRADSSRRLRRRPRAGYWNWWRDGPKRARNTAGAAAEAAQPSQEIHPPCWQRSTGATAACFAWPRETSAAWPSVLPLPLAIPQPSSVIRLCLAGGARACRGHSVTGEP